MTTEETKSNEESNGLEKLINSDSFINSIFNDYEITKELPPEYRRLDSLADMFEFNNMCAAVSLINGKIYISSNEFTESTGLGRQDTKKIVETMEYFKKIATNNNNNISFEKILKNGDKIFKTLLSGYLYRGKSGVPAIIDNQKFQDDLSKYICSNNITKKKCQEFWKKYIESNSVDFNDQSNVSSAFFDACKLRVAFVKLTHAIYEASILYKNNNDGTSAKITPEQLNAFKNFNEKNILRFVKKDNKVHAEIQILYKLLTEDNAILNNSTIKKEYYIGISKKCCRNCAAMLKITNEVLKKRTSQSENNNHSTIIYRGIHGLDFSKWKIPKKWKNKKNPKEGTVEEVMSEIIKLYRKSTFKKWKANGKRKQRFNASDSDADYDDIIHSSTNSIHLASEVKEGDDNHNYPHTHNASPLQIRNCFDNIRAHSQHMKIEEESNKEITQTKKKKKVDINDHNGTPTI